MGVGMKTNITLASILLVLLSSCASKPPAQPTIDVSTLQTLAYETAIAGINGTATANAPTATLQPITTFTPVATPTITFTPTSSPTPIPLNLFNPLTFVDGLRNSPNGYIGSYIKALGSNAGDVFTGLSDAPTNPFWLAPADYSPRGIYVNIEKDPSADSTVDKLGNSKWLWIYGIVKETKNKYPLVSVIHTESIPDDQLPRGDGVYRVNVDIASGRWKSMSDATETQSCYWARIASDGSIIDNFFGYGGTIVYISDSDFAVEFKNCSVMVYLGK